VRLTVFIPLQAELLEPHGRDESLDALLAAPDGWHHEYRTDRNLVHELTVTSFMTGLIGR
jgi:hypothetical protein